MDIEKELQQLKQRISSLETQRNVLFGNSYTSAGSSSSDYLIKTRGKVKIQIGNKFIDLLKDGKINVDSNFIFKEKKVGSKDGIYIIGDGEDAKAVISIGGSQIDLKGKAGTTYVSFLGTQETTSEQKYTALQNIGFLYKNVSDIQSNGLRTGIVYVESEQKLYIVQDGQLTEFTIDFPNPYPKQFVLSKSDKSKGALVIKGTGIENSLAFDSLFLYSSEGNTYVDSSGEVYIRLGEEEKILIGESQVVFSNKVISQTFQSKNATGSSGFRLYVDQGESTLEVDNLIVRKSYNLSENSSSNLYPKYWYRENNLISDISKIENSDDSNQVTYAIKLVYQNAFQVDDSLYTFVSIKNDQESVSDWILLPLKVVVFNNDSDEPDEPSEPDNSGVDNTIYVNLQQDLISEGDYEKVASANISNLLKFQTIFLAGRKDSIPLIRRDQQNIDLLTSTGFADEQNIEKVQTRIGNIEELNLSGKENSKEVPIKGVGMYSNNACFLKAQYTSLYSLPPKDSSSKFASTEWVNKLVSSLNPTPPEGENKSLPVGSIIMFNGLSSEIPDGWHICDGTEGTPNLTGKFIKASNTSGETGGKSTIQILEENMPRHTHTFVGNKVTTSESGAHTHTIRAKYGKSDNANDKNCLETGTETDLITTSQSGAHTHTIDMSATQLSYQGGGKPIEFEPLYYSLIYIMKMS